MKKLGKGSLVKVTPTSEGKRLAKQYGLKIGKVYPIVKTEGCHAKCPTRPWCPGKLQVGSMTMAVCWGYNDWFGLQYAPKHELDQILGLMEEIDFK